MLKKKDTIKKSLQNISEHLNDIKKIYTQQRQMQAFLAQYGELLDSLYVYVLDKFITDNLTLLKEYLQALPYDTNGAADTIKHKLTALYETFKKESALLNVKSDPLKKKDIDAYIQAVENSDIPEEGKQMLLKSVGIDELRKEAGLSAKKQVKHNPTDDIEAMEALVEQSKIALYARRMEYWESQRKRQLITTMMVWIAFVVLATLFIIKTFF